MKATARVVIVLIGCVSVAVLVWIFKGSAANSAVVGNADVVGGVAGLLTLVVAVVGLRPGHQRTRNVTAGPNSEPISAAIEYLATRTLRYWQTQAKGWRITTPAPAAVHWRWADEDVAAPPEDLGMAGPAMLTAGVVTKLREQLYQRLPQGSARLVVVGAAGAGKTGAMLLLLLDILSNRSAGSRDQVPVWLTLGSWDPSTAGLLEFAEATLVRDYNGLVASEHGGPTTAAELLSAGRLALFLDGLDEMPPGLQGVALEAIDRLGSDVPVVLSCRRQEYQKAVSQGRLYGAAVIELLPLGLDEVERFLIAEQIGERRQNWRRITEHLRAYPDCVAARALTTPLALTLARDTYATSGDPRDLLDEANYPDPDQLLQYLLSRFLNLAYPERVQRSHALHWLSWIARHMGTNRDLAWWEIIQWMPQRQIRADIRNTSAVFGGLAAGLIGTLVAGPATGIVAAFAGGFAPEAFRVTMTFRPGVTSMRWPERQEIWSLMKSAITLGAVCAFLGEVIAAILGAHQNLGPFSIWSVDGFVIGFVLGVLSSSYCWQSAAIDSSLATPMQAYRTEGSNVAISRVHGLLVETTFAIYATLAGSILGALIGLVPGVITGHIETAVKFWSLAVAMGTGIGIEVLFLFAGAGAREKLKIAEVHLLLRGQGRIRFMPLLETALQRQVLRQAGAVYQFRHAALQDHLSEWAIGGDGGVRPS
jgi:hypothetical protein